MKLQHCPHCGQVLPQTRAGVRLPPLKVRIFDAVKRAGVDGLLWNELFEIVYGRGSGVQRERLKSHIWQLNDRLEGTGLRIVGRGGSYRLTKI